MDMTIVNSELPTVSKMVPFDGGIFVELSNNQKLTIKKQFGQIIAHLREPIQGTSDKTKNLSTWSVDDTEIREHLTDWTERFQVPSTIVPKFFDTIKSKTCIRNGKPVTIDVKVNRKDCTCTGDGKDITFHNPDLKGTVTVSVPSPAGEPNTFTFSEKTQYWNFSGGEFRDWCERNDLLDVLDIIANDILQFLEFPILAEIREEQSKS
jgi:hypothetical protein